AGLVKVVSPIDDTPAFKAGLQPGDLITHIDGQEILGMTLAEAVEKMRGKIGTPIKLSIRRADREPFDVTLTRDVVKIRSVRSRQEGGVGYIRISSFSEQTDEGVRNEIAKLKKDAPGGLQGLVLDLRNNPGGLLAQAVAVSDDFLEQGEIVSTRARKPEDAQRFNARPGEVGKDLPIVVLINAGTASASEIVAGALQDHGRAILLGTKSFGKGSVQTIIPLIGHGAMRLTTARYYTPSGRSIQAVGIEPDIVVEQAKIEALTQAGQRREADLRGALDLAVPNGGAGTGEGPGSGVPGSGAPGRGGSGSDAPPTSSTAEGPVPADVDYQLVRALDLVRGLSLFSEKMSQRTQ
ncbi:MAG: S41 family peptidase, partial [Rhodospirillales bacterium]